MSEKNEKTKTNNCNDVRIVLQKIGDSLYDKYDESDDLIFAQTSIYAYGKAINAAKAQLMHKKIHGSPETIDFFETE